MNEGSQPARKYTWQLSPGISKIFYDEDLPYLTMKRCNLAVCVVGMKYVGKSTVVRFMVEERNFSHLCLSSVARSVARGLYWTSGQWNAKLKDLGNELRALHDNNAYFAVRRLLTWIRRRGALPSDVVLDGIKRPEEVLFLSQFFKFRFRLLILTSPLEDRKCRAIELGEYERSSTEFESAVDERDAGLHANEHGMAVASIRRGADCISSIPKKHIIEIENRNESKVGNLIDEVRLSVLKEEL